MLSNMSKPLRVLGSIVLIAEIIGSVGGGLAIWKPNYIGLAIGIILVGLFATLIFSFILFGADPLLTISIVSYYFI